MNTLNEVSPPTLQRLKISALCRISLSGSLLLAAGVAMSIVGYYSRQETSAFVTSDPLVPLSYLGPVVMGAGAFILIIVCVVTLESRDKSESKNSNWKNISSKFRLSSSEQGNNNNNNNNTNNKSVQLETAQSQSSKVRQPISANNSFLTTTRSDRKTTVPFENWNIHCRYWRIDCQRGYPLHFAVIVFSAEK
ncbi:hypothetical protein T03_3694 [Trichinella britovi]|uniref:Transmembrane protein n=1 Tax=Trichinella britovi TaxID=45882 RepID=A0A0V1CNZ2_TRIBR|nr:hypothetical protein T03_3694 [Trichinella britovi]